MFTMSRHHEEPILPHSHRFDFRCLVLRGAVHNHIWRRTSEHRGDSYMVSNVTYEGELGLHHREDAEEAHFAKGVASFKAGEEYSMRAEEFHSIYFERGTEVLFFEGPNRLELSQILEPIVMGERIPLFRTDEWMFKRETAA
jgi:hypothetical protein